MDIFKLYTNRSTIIMLCSVWLRWNQHFGATNLMLHIWGSVGHLRGVTDKNPC